MGVHRAYQTEPGLSDWARKLLSLPVDAVLATVNPDGSAHTAPVGFAFDGQRFLIASGSVTRKVANIEADPRVRVLVIAPAASTGAGDGWVAADGIARIVRGADALELTRRAVAPYLTEEGQRGYEQVFLPLMDVAIVVTPQRWHTWQEQGMLETMIEHGYTEEDAGRWYVPRPA